LGIAVAGIQRNSNTSATITLSGNSLQDYDANITDLTLSVAADEINDYSGLPIEVSTGIVLIASVENIIVSHTGLTEANLNGSVIDLSLENEKFADATLDISNVTIQTGTVGASISQILYLTDSTAQVELSFDGPDFDSNQTLKIGIAGNEFIFGDSLESNSLQVLAFNDDEIFTLADDGQILEGHENAETIGLTLSGGTFATVLNTSVWVFENLPHGVIVGTIQKVDSQHVTFILEGNATTDYDSDITQFTVQIPESEFDDYSGTNVVVTGGVTFTAVLENSSLFIEHAGLNESNLDQAIINMKLVDGKFDLSQQGNVSGITLNNVPDGLSVAVYQIVNDTTANLTLNYLGFDFDTDYSNFSISLDPIMLSPQTTLNSNNLTIQASIEPLVLVSYDNQINEGAENGELITITLTEGTFVGSFLISNINLSSLPNGVSISDLQQISDKVCTFKLAGNRTTDYDDNISSIICSISKVVFQSYFGGDVSVETDILLSAFNESLQISHEGLTEENLNGAVINLKLNQDTFTDELLAPSNVTLFNAPQGVSVNQINFVNNSQANLILTFDGTDFTSNIPDFFVEINQAELFGIENLQSNPLLISEGVGIFDDQSKLGLSIYASEASVFVTVNNLPKTWESATIAIYDTKGTRVHNSDLKYLKVNKINLNVLSGYYLVQVKVNGIEFVNKVFILPE
jgi:hypothetical protein